VIEILAIVGFIVGSLFLVRFGVVLARTGDDLAQRTGLGRVFVGSLFVALATSLPEVATDITASLANAPDLAVGDLFGSSMANMAILAIVDLRYRGKVWPAVDLGHARVAAVGLVLTAIAALSILSPLPFSIGWVGLDTVFIAGLYICAVAWFRRVPTVPGFPRPESVTTLVLVETQPESTSSLRTLVIRFSAASLGILIAAPIVSLSVKQIASFTGIGETFLGSTLLAISTSLPEFVVVMAAIKIGAHDLALGNLFGSNAMNMSILFIADLFYFDGPILAAVDPSQAIAAIGAIILMALAVAAIVGGTETRVGRLEPDAIVVIVAYITVLIVVASNSW
jgi:cation:H+ antiporter